MKTVVCAIGNRMRGDDAFGPLLIDALKNKKPEGVLLIDCAGAPENFIGTIIPASPDKIIIADAFDMKEKPGTLREIKPENIHNTTYSTHNAPLSMFLRALSQTGAKITILGFQPKETGFGKELSKEAKSAINKARKIIMNFIQLGFFSPL